MADLFDLILGNSSSAPTMPMANVDPNTQALINQQLQSAKRPTQDFASEQAKGVESSMNRLGGSMGGDIGKTGVSPGFGDAIRNAYSGQTTDFLNKIKLNNEIVAQQRKKQELAQASRHALHQAGVETSYLQSLTDAQNQMEAQRASIISQISGSAGYAVGTYLGSRSKSIGNGNSSPDQTLQFQSGVQQPASYNAMGGMYA